MKAWMDKKQSIPDALYIEDAGCCGIQSR